jgi:hypothetical protein
MISISGLITVKLEIIFERIAEISDKIFIRMHKIAYADVVYSYADMFDDNAIIYNYRAVYQYYLAIIE